MSDETGTRQLLEASTPPVLTGALGDHYIEIPEFACDVPGCDVKKDTLRKLNSHKGQAHKRHAVKKKVAKVAPTVVDEEKPSTPTKRTFKEIDHDGNGRVLLKSEGSWWIATKVDVV